MELVCGRLQGRLGVDLQAPAQAYDGEEHVAELLADTLVGLAVLQGLDELTPLFFNLAAHFRGVGPVEAYRGSLFAGTEGAQQSREGAWDARKRPFILLLALTLFGLHRLPILQGGGGGRG